MTAKPFYRIGEVSALVGEKQHVLRSIFRDDNQQALAHLRNMATGRSALLTQAPVAGGSAPALAVDHVPQP